MFSLALHQRLLLDLLKSALDDHSPSAELYTSLTDTDWRAILELAHQQSISALIAERILSLPSELLPSRGLCMELALILHTVEAGNAECLKTLAKVQSAYTDAGLPFVLLKGQTMAQLYPRPEHRSSGDIDLYLYRAGDYERANAWARGKGFRLEGNSIYEQCYWYGRTAVENHLLVNYFGIPRYDRVLGQMLEKVREQDAWAWTKINDERYRTLPSELNVIYIFVHILHHFSYLGIGLRQICDWLMLIRRHGHELDLDLVEQYAEALDLMRPMRLFALMTVRHLGANASDFPFSIPSSERDIRLSDLILEDTFRGGNFGFETFAGRTFRRPWQRRWFMFLQTTKRSLRVSAVSPEHIRLIPLISIITRLRLFFRI